jgi:phosphoglycolate phosphatase-like HAD superfamily hydrolase
LNSAAFLNLLAKDGFMIAVLFDLDGTLLDSTDLDTECYIKAVRTVLGEVAIRPEWGHYQEVTALAILKDILKDNSLSSGKELWEEVREEFGQRVSAALQNGRSCCAREGAQDTINLLRENKDFQIALATGDWSHTAGMKLTSAGLNFNGIPLCSSDQKENRIEIMKEALRNLEGPFQHIFYVGDGLWDQKASRELGWGFIGIGPNLQGRCDDWFESFGPEFQKHITSFR